MSAVPVSAQRQTEPAARGPADPTRDGNPDHGRQEDHGDLGVAHHDDAHRERGRRGEARRAFDRGPVDQPQGEEADEQPERLRLVAQELEVHPERRDQEQAARDRDPGRHPAAEQQDARQRGPGEDRQAIRLEPADAVKAQQREGQRGVRGEREVVGVERLQPAPLREQRRQAAGLGHELRQVAVVPDGRRRRQRLRPEAGMRDRRGGSRSPRWRRRAGRRPRAGAGRGAFRQGPRGRVARGAAPRSRPGPRRGRRSR